MDLDVQRVLEFLQRIQTRATYSAVAGYLNIQTRALGEHLGRRCPLASWVVSKTTGKPTGYAEAECHSDLYTNEKIITDSEGIFLNGMHYDYYWSSTSVDDEPGIAWRKHRSGAQDYGNKNRFYHYVWPVRPLTYSENIRAGSVTFNADSQNYTLVIVTEQGTTTPEAGTYTNYCWQSAVTCAVDQVEVNPEWFAGWSGAVVTNQAGTNIVITLTNLSNSVTAHYSGDVDDDGIMNTNEAIHGTDPWIADTDSDGLDDGQEVIIYETNPLDPDMDADGLLDGEEILTYSSNPNIFDTDNDGFGDGFEVSTGYSPVSSNSTPDALSAILTAVEFQFNAANGVSYKVEATADLSNSWDVVETDIIGQGDVVIRFYSTEGQSTRFFRAIRN